MRRAGAESRDPRQLIAGILLAAGRSSRFGRQKLLERWRGAPLLWHAARSFTEAGLDPVLVIVPDDQRFSQALAGLPLRLLANAQPERGISHSIAIGVAALSADVTAVLIGVADQPRVTAEAIAQLAGAFQPGRIVAPRYGDHRGNPVVFDRAFFPELLALRGDRGGQQVVESHGDAVIEVELSDAMGVDVDRPEDWPV